LTADGLAVLKQRKPVTLTKPIAAPQPAMHRTGEIACDETLFERLRQLRKRLADERAVPPYIVFSDVALRQMARNYPDSQDEFARISGVGDKKLQEFGAVFLGEIADHLRIHPRQIFADDSFEAPAARRSRLNDTTRETLRRFQAGETAEQIARSRGLATSTVYGHLCGALEAGERIELNQLFSAEEQRAIAAAFAKSGFGNLTAVFETLAGKFDYGQLRIFRAAQPKQTHGQERGRPARLFGNGASDPKVH